MKVLLTGFDPVGEDKINPSIEAVKSLPAEIAGAEIVKLEVPTAFRRSGEILIEAIERERPEITICTGLAGSRPDISVERVAINVDDSGGMADNDGELFEDQPIRQDGQTAYFSTLPVREIVEAVKKKGIPASISNTAGTFGCNHVMYLTLYLAEQQYPGMWGGFIHVPRLPQQVLDRRPAAPSMALSTTITALTTAVEVAVKRYRGES